MYIKWCPVITADYDCNDASIWEVVENCNCYFKDISIIFFHYADNGPDVFAPIDETQTGSK